MKLKNYILEGNVSQKHQSPNKSRDKLPKDIIIVLHYTAFGGKEGGSVAEYLSRASTRASAQIVVGREGDVHQLMPLNHIAWHAGQSSYKGKPDVNKFSIGIEIDNWGWLDGRGINLPEDQIFKATRSGKHLWETYNDTQLKSVEEVIEAIVNSKEFNVMDIVGHEDIAPQRKQDPGPALDEFKAKVKAKYKFSRATKVNLNLRQSESTSAVILTTIPEGSPIEVIEETQSGWAKVKFGNREGFVVQKYLT